MKKRFFKNIFLFSSFFIFPACEDLSFTTEDIFSEKEIKKIIEETVNETEEERKEKSNSKEAPPLLKKSPQNKIPNEQINEEAFNSQIEEDLETSDPDKKENKQFSKEEVTTLSEDLELSEDTVIQNKKVVLDMMKIQTKEFNLKIESEEFVSNHSLIQNFPEGERAKEKEEGKKGGDILIETKKAIGSLKLILNGEDGGLVPKRRLISKEEREKLKGLDGEDGKNATYKILCRNVFFPLLLGMSKIPLGKKCWEECNSFPTGGAEGGDGREGLPGWDGKRGGNSGSFYLKAYDLSEFHLTSVKKIPGLGSKGGKGSFGGVRGERGRNGRDYKNLCKFKPLLKPRNGKAGQIGKKGQDGKDGLEGEACLESLNDSNGFNFQSEENIICY